MILKINVKTGSREEKLEKINNHEYSIHVKERAEKGKANLKIIKLLTEEFNVNPKDVKIKNKTGRKKIVEIAL